MNFKNVKNLQHFRVCVWVMHPRRFSSTLVQSSLESYTHFCIFHPYILDKNYEYSNLERICTKIVDIFSVDEHFCMIYSIQRFCGFILYVLSANIAVKSSRNVHISSCWMTVYIIQWEDSHIKKNTLSTRSKDLAIECEESSKQFFVVVLPHLPGYHSNDRG